MTNKLAIILICCCFTFNTYAQTIYAVKGIVTDTATKTKLESATISILNAKDSILQKFAYTNRGLFNINNLKPGKFLLLVTYPDYADYSADFILDVTHPLKDFGDLSLILKSRLLNEVIVKAKVIPIKIKGDTTEFDAAAYATQKNAKVEDLLKQLPGMRINQSGAILFQGEQVQKVLVDGEEFFGDDPVLVTKNVRADMVSKIQVYNDKSEMAKQTGVDDGVKVKTINVQLREDKKRGVFGKADGGAGTDRRYTGQVMANKFSPAEKMAMYGNLGNTGSIGLGGGDNSKYGGGFSDYLYDGVGIPAARDGGVHYDGKWNKDKQTLNTSYKLGALDVDKQGNAQSQVSLPGSFNRTNNDNASHSHSFRQSLDVIFTAKIDSTSSLYISMNGVTASGHTTSRNNTVTTRGNDTLLNTNNNNSIADYQNKNARAFISYQKRLKKPGRSFSLYASGNASQSTSTNYLKSDLKYYQNNSATDSARSMLIDQYKPNTSNSHYGSVGFNYTEPLAKSLSLILGYDITDNVSNNNQQSFNKSASGVYNVPDLLYSNNYSTQNPSNNYSLAFRFNKDKIRALVSTTLSNSVLKQTDHIVDTVLTRKFVNWSPYVNFSYQISKAANFSFYYNGNTQQPSISQIQPLRQNADPLNITIGNSVLKPEFDNNFSFNYRVYQAAYDRGINFSGGYSNRINAIVNNRSTDTSGNNIYQSSNLIGHQPSNWNVHFNVYGHLTKLDFILYPGINASGNRSFNYVNGQLSESKSVTYSPDLSLQKNQTNYSYGMGISGTFTSNSASLQSAANNTRGYNASFNFYTKLPLNFFIGGDGNYEFRAANQVFTQNFERFLLKAYFGKTFLKEENLKVTITGNDLLNQNTGYNRYGNSDNFSETRYNVIKRFFMFSVTWDFSKFGKVPQPQKQ